MKYDRLNPLHWLLALFSNSRKVNYTAGIPADLYIGKSEATRRLLYWLRNPSHDFGHYIIGFEGDPEFRTVRGNAQDTLIEGGIVALRRWRWLLLPYLAYQHTFASGGAFQFYAGWRPTGGAGLKLRWRKPGDH